MRTSLRNNNDAYRIVMTQLFAVVVLFPFVQSFWDRETAVSVTLGGLVCVLPNLFLYRSMFTHFGAQAAKKIIKGFYWGELGKIALTTVLFSIALNAPGVLPGSLLVGFVIAQLFFWLAPVVVIYVLPRVKALVL
jgi:ATP synthase protein I